MRHVGDAVWPAAWGTHMRVACRTCITVAHLAAQRQAAEPTAAPAGWYGSSPGSTTLSSLASLASLRGEHSGGHRAPHALPALHAWPARAAAQQPLAPHSAHRRRHVCGPTAAGRAGMCAAHTHRWTGSLFPNGAAQSKYSCVCRCVACGARSCCLRCAAGIQLACSGPHAAAQSLRAGGTAEGTMHALPGLLLLRPGVALAGFCSWQKYTFSNSSCSGAPA